MKIASIVPYKILPPVKGGERHIFFFVQALNNLQPVNVITVKENAALTAMHLQAAPLLGSASAKGRYLNLFLYFKVRRYCRQQHITQVIIEHPYYGWLGFLLQKFAGIKYIIRSHNIEGLRFKSLQKKWWPLLLQYEKWAHRHAAYNFFITQEDMDFAIKNFHLNPQKCAVSPYGIALQKTDISIRAASRHMIVEAHHLPGTAKIILFNGALDYGPNSDAVQKIITYINPQLQKNMQQPYQIIICGKGLPQNLQAAIAQSKNILYAGFVADINLYFSGSDVFICPVTAGGGIKTKLVEALAAGTRCVAFASAAIGIPVQVTGNRLQVVADNDYNAFCHTITHPPANDETIDHTAFHDFFNWNSIAQKAIEAIKNL